MKHKFIIAGTGRCGTKWCATALRMVGIHCGHEQVFCTEQLPGMTPQTWGRYEGDSSLASVPFLNKYPRERKLLVVRNPLRFTESIVSVGPFTEGSQPRGLLRYLEAHIPEVLRSQTEIEAALRYWLTWNHMALQFVDEFYRIEGLTVEELLEGIGEQPRWEPFPLGIVNARSERGTPTLEWEDVPRSLSQDAMELAVYFGYQI